MITTELILPDGQGNIIHLPQALITSWQCTQDIPHEMVRCRDGVVRAEREGPSTMSGVVSFQSQAGAEVYTYKTALENFTIKEMLKEITRRLDA